MSFLLHTSSSRWKIIFTIIFGLLLPSQVYSSSQFTRSADIEQTPKWSDCTEFFCWTFSLNSQQVAFELLSKDSEFYLSSFQYLWLIDPATHQYTSNFILLYRSITTNFIPT